MALKFRTWRYLLEVSRCKSRCFSSKGPPSAPRGIAPRRRAAARAERPCDAPLPQRCLSAAFRRRAMPF
eukprot:543815-Alexandrium_andersonii.AAC.1